MLSVVVDELVAKPVKTFAILAALRTTFSKTASSHNVTLLHQ